MTQSNTSLALDAFHTKELTQESAIDPAVVAERGYTSIGRPNNNVNFGLTMPNNRRWMHGSTREFLSFLGFPSWAIREEYFYPGLWIPQYTPTGQMYAGQWKPKNPIANRDGKRMKYTSAKGAASRLDVHPRWSKDRGDRLPAINDPTERLWITEGVKKADSLTSRGEITVALAGVFNWRNGLGGLGDWEDVRLKDREVVICFDADAITKPAVGQAMARLGKWLKYKGAKTVWFCVVPTEINGAPVGVKGVDDFFAAGGSVKDLERAFSKKPPKHTSSEDTFTDARLAETLSNEVLDGRYVWAAGLEWMEWNGKRWAEVHEVTILEGVRQWALDNFADAADRLRKNEGDAAAEVDGWRGMLAANRARTVLSLARGIVERKAGDFDADPDLLNTPDGVVRLDTGDVLPHDPELLMTKITSGSYRPGFTHPDWDRALTVLPASVMEWFRVRIGQAVTGHTTADGIVIIMKGGGENGKSLFTTDGLLPAFGNYASAASPKLFGGKEHSTERAELRGQRLVIAEELTEGGSIDVTALKQVADVGVIKARKTHKDNMEFLASHSLIATTNYTPSIGQTDDGTWRRLALLVFPYRFVKPGLPITDPEHERRGDPTLKARIKANKSGQHDAAVTWAVEGAIAWYRNSRDIERAVDAGEEPPASVLLPCPEVAADSLAWRREADRVLGYWETRLVAEEGSYVVAAELLADFNLWLDANGHHAWPKETFGPRFIDHPETRKARVTRKKMRSTAKDANRIVRTGSPDPFAAGGGGQKPLPKQVDVFAGLRYRHDADDD